jgi:hypothetical protein
MVIDHINGDKTDNRICNLRIATQSQNAANAANRKNNTSGFRGVSRRGNKWQSYITVNGKRKHLGFYSTKEEASHAHAIQSKIAWGDYSNATPPPETFQPVAINPACGQPKKATPNHPSHNA